MRGGAFFTFPVGKGGGGGVRWCWCGGTWLRSEKERVEHTRTHTHTHTHTHRNCRGPSPWGPPVKNGTTKKAVLTPHDPPHTSTFLSVASPGQTEQQVRPGRVARRRVEVNPSCSLHPPPAY